MVDSDLDDPRPRADPIDVKRTQEVVRERLFGIERKAVKVGRFVIEGCAGEGAMGRVYVARDTALDRRVALKLIDSEMVRSRDRLVDEARALAQLAHPNVVPIYEVGEHDGEVFLAMELVDGSDLRRWLMQQARSVEEIVDVMLQAARGIAAAHAVGLVHRDVKPANILVGNDGRVRVVDFGLARPATDADEGARAGTPAFMSPEVLEGAIATAKSDQYSVGRTLQVALHDRTAGGPRVPRRLAAVVRRACAPDPGQRYPSVAAFIAALEHDPRRRRALLVVAGVGAIGIAGAIGLGGRREAPQCDANAELMEVWNEARASELDRAFAGVGVAYATRSANTVVATLDRYAARWVELREDACRSRASGRSSAAEAAATAVCLDEGRRALAAKVEVLLEPDAVTIRKSLDLLMALPDLRECGRVGVPVPLRSAEADRVRDRLAAAAARRAAGRYDAAVELAKQAHDAAVALGDPTLLAAAEHSVALDLRRAGDYPRADDLLIAAASRAEAAGQDLLAARILTDRIVLLGYFQRDVAAATKLQPEVAVKLARAGSEEGEDAAQLAWMMGVVRSIAGDNEGGLADMRRALALREELLGADDPLVASTRSGIGTVLRDMGRLEEAERLQRDALATITAALGPEHPEVATVEHDLGTMLVFAGRFDEAVRLLESSLAKTAAALGADNPEVAHVHNNLANVLEDLGRFDEALDHHEQALRIRGESLDPDNALLAGSLQNVARVELLMHRLDRARAHIEQAIAIYEAAFGSDYRELAWARGVHASILVEQGQLDGALAARSEALRVVELVQGPDHPDVGTALDGLGAVHEARGEWSDAERCYRRSLSVYERAEVAPNVRATAARHLADLQRRRGPRDEAPRKR